LGGGLDRSTLSEWREPPNRGAFFVALRAWLAPFEEESLMTEVQSVIVSTIILALGLLELLVIQELTPVGGPPQGARLTVQSKERLPIGGLFSCGQLVRKSHQI